MKVDPKLKKIKEIFQRTFREKESGYQRVKNIAIFIYQAVTLKINDVTLLSLPKIKKGVDNNLYVSSVF